MNTIEKQESPAAPPPTQDEKTIAGLCHFAILLSMLVGPLCILVPLIVWLIEKDKPARSEFITFHAKQALFYQIAVICILAGSFIIALILTFVLIGLLLYPLIFLAGVAAVVYGIVGGINVLQGKSFVYYYVGNKLVQKL